MSYKQKKIVLLDVEARWVGGGQRDYGDIIVKEVTIDEGVPDIKTRTYSPNPGDKIYLYPGCDVPRFKMKHFCQENQVALVKTPQRANACFIGDKTIKELYTNRHFYVYGVDYFTQWMIDNETVKNWMGVRQAIAGHDKVYATSSMSSFLEDKNVVIKKYKGKETDAYFDVIQDEAKCLEIFSNPTLYFQDEMLRRINSGTVIDAETYENLRTMLSSTDAENVRLAMEMMANSDYEKCCVYLLKLMKEFGEKMYHQSTRHHVNFKSLLKFFNIKYLHTIDIDIMVDSLLSKKLLNKANLDMLMEQALSKVSSNGNCRHFSVRELDLSDTIKKGLQENILDTKMSVVSQDPKEWEEDDPDEEEGQEESDDIAGKEEEADLSSATMVLGPGPKGEGIIEPEMVNDSPELYISYSGLNRLLHSPQLFYKHYILGEREERLEPHLIDGKVIHCLLLDNGSFDKLFQMVPVSLPTGNTRLVVDKVFEYYQQELADKGESIIRVQLADYATEICEVLKDIDLHQSLKTDAQRLEKIITEPSKTYFEFLKIKGNKDLIDQETLARCKRAVEILSANEQVTKLLGLNKFETGNIQVHNELKIQVDTPCPSYGFSFGIRGIVDNIKIDYDNQVIYINDLKTTSKTIGEFQETLDYFHYNLQAAMYDRLVGEKFSHIMGPDWRIVFNFVVIDRYEQVYCFEVTPDSMLTWRIELLERLKEVEWHLRNKSFSLPYKFATSAVLL